MRVVLHGFGSFPIVFWHMIQYARSINAPIEWGIILTTDHHYELFVQLLGAERVVVLKNGYDNRLTKSAEILYPGFLYRDIEAEKRTFKFDPAEKQRNRAIGLYRQVRDFIQGFRPSHALVSQVEGFDGKAFIAAAREYGAEIVVPTSCRSLGGVFFSRNDIESLPVYVRDGFEEQRSLAKDLIKQFRHAPKLLSRCSFITNDEILDDYVPALPVRALKSARRWLTMSGSFQKDYLRASWLNNLPLLRDGIWAVRRFANERYCDIRSYEELPKRYIFYPLQYTPESSINTPAPYFIDQLRAIDAIRFSMPSDCVLVVKEHPACILLRNSRFVRRLQRTGGVIVAHYGLSSLELIKRAGLTISVTGTATLEALLLGKSALSLGGALVSDLLGGICTISELENRITNEFERNVPDEDTVDAVASLLNVRYEAYFGSPGMPGEPVLRRKNIERFTEAFFDHCRRVQCATTEGL